MKIVIRNLFRLSLAAGLLVGASLVNAELVVVVNPDNAMTTISAKNLSRLYLGKARSFPGGARAKPINQPTGSAARNEFYQTYANMSDAQVKSHWSKLMFSGKGNPPAEAANDAEVKAAVAGDASAIGYIDAAAADESVKTLNVTP
jgi:ABC-type phosphate transport system substrate-binding protein